MWLVKIFFCIYKTYLMSAEGYKNDGVDMLIMKKTGEIWPSMKDEHAGLVLKNMPDPVLKQIYGIYQTENRTKEQIKKYKMTERQIFEKNDNSSEDKLYAKNNKNAYVRNDVMTTIIKRSRGEKEMKEK